jgi:hypothetical protein
MRIRNTVRRTDKNTNFGNGGWDMVWDPYLLKLWQLAAGEHISVSVSDPEPYGSAKELPPGSGSSCVQICSESQKPRLFIANHNKNRHREKWHNLLNVWRTDSTVQGLVLVVQRSLTFFYDLDTDPEPRSGSAIRTRIETFAWIRIHKNPMRILKH